MVNDDFFVVTMCNGLLFDNNIFLRNRPKKVTKRLYTVNSIVYMTNGVTVTAKMFHYVITHNIYVYENKQHQCM